MQIRAALLALGLGVLPARAGTSLHYTARLHGVAFFDASYCLTLDAGAYDAHLTARTLGLAEFMVHGAPREACRAACRAIR